MDINELNSVFFSGTKQEKPWQTMSTKYQAERLLLISQAPTSEEYWLCHWHPVRLVHSWKILRLFRLH